MKRIIMMDYAGGHSAYAGTERGQIYDSQQIADLMSLFRDVGFDTVWFRTSYCGTVCYHSKVMKPFKREYRLPMNVLAEAMAQFDPLEVAIREAHRCGLAILAWITPFDNYFPGLEDPVLADHPEWLVCTRDGRKTMRGIPCLAYQPYVDLRVGEVQEVMEYGCDGVYHSWATHTLCTVAEGDPDEPACFGYNTPIIDEYRRRYGSPEHDNSYDPALIGEIHSDYLDAFVERCGATIAAARGQYVTTTTSGVLTSDRYSWYKYRVGGADVFYLPAHWRKWVEQGWIQAIGAGAGGHWLAENEQAAGPDVPVIGVMHAAWGVDDPSLPPHAQEGFGRRVRRCLQGPFGAVALQESDTIEANQPELWDELREIFRTC